VLWLNGLSRPQDNARLSAEQHGSAGASWLPYTLIDQVLLAAESQGNLSLREENLRNELQTVISNRIKYAERLTAESKQIA
jgi:hypothetical protein